MWKQSVWNAEIGVWSCVIPFELCDMYCIFSHWLKKFVPEVQQKYCLTGSAQARAENAGGEGASSDIWRVLWIR